MNHSELHKKYDAVKATLDAALKAAAEFKTEADGAFDWEMNEIINELRLARRYSGKPGEVLYCNWRWCVHAAPFEDQERGQDIDTAAAAEARAIPLGDGEQWFKGRVHPECAKALSERRSV